MSNKGFGFTRYRFFLSNLLPHCHANPQNRIKGRSLPERLFNPMKLSNLHWKCGSISVSLMHSTCLSVNYYQLPMYAFTLKIKTIVYFVQCYAPQD